MCSCTKYATLHVHGQGNFIFPITHNLGCWLYNHICRGISKMKVLQVHHLLKKSNNKLTQLCCFFSLSVVGMFQAFLKHNLVYTTAAFWPQTTMLSCIIIVSITLVLVSFPCGLGTMLTLVLVSFPSRTTNQHNFVVLMTTVFSFTLGYVSSFSKT